MGCITGIIKKIIILALIVAFFVLGGWAFLKNKINDYKNPPRIDFINTSHDWADFSYVSGDYQLSRCYKKISAKYLPTGQKITIFDLKNEDKISVNDFKTKEIDEKISSILDKLKDSFITFEDFEIIQRGSYIAKNKTIPFIVFSARVRNIPFKNVINVFIFPLFHRIHMMEV